MCTVPPSRTPRVAAETCIPDPAPARDSSGCPPARRSDRDAASRCRCSSPLRQLVGGAAGLALLMPAQGWAAVASDTNMFAPAGSAAKSIFDLGVFVIVITAGIWLAVMGILVAALIKFRTRPNDDGSEPPQVFGSMQIEAAWTIIPILLIVVLFLATARMIFAIQDAPRPKHALEINAIGHQFWWEFRYPELGITTANELHIPVDTKEAPSQAFLRLTSADVVHSFWVPRLAGKTDMFPDRINELWMDAAKPGMYEGQCAQFCGPQHANMLLRVYADTPAQFAEWVKSQQTPGIQDPAVAVGRQEFESLSCINCHRVDGTVAQGRFGPDLTHLMSRHTIAAGAADNTEDNLKRWIESPDAFKPGVLMPPMHLDSQQLDEVVAYLRTLK